MMKRKDSILREKAEAYSGRIIKNQYDSMMNDNEEIIKILVKSIKTLKTKIGKL